MNRKMMAWLLAFALLAGMLTACGAQETAASSAPSEASSASEAVFAPVPTTAETPEPEPEETEEPSEEPAASQEPEAEPEEPPAEEPEEPEEPAGPVTVTFSDGQTFEATVGEDFVFFFQCDAPGDMGAPEEGQEGAGITVSDGEVSYSHVGLGGPNRYPTSELVTVSGFTGDFQVTICEEATFMDATYTVYTDPQEIEEAIAFADYMAAQQAANPMPGGEAPPN